MLEWVRGAIGPKKFENQTPKMCLYISWQYILDFKFLMYIRCRINKQKKLEEKEEDRNLSDNFLTLMRAIQLVNTEISCNKSTKARISQTRLEALLGIKS